MTALSSSPLPIPRPVAIVGDRTGEGAIWCAEEQAVYWTDINRFLVHRMTYPDRHLRTWIFDEPPTALALTTEPGRILVALASRLVWWWPAEDRREAQGFTLGDHPRVRLNDGRADPLGNFWVGSMFNNVTAVGGPTDEHHAPGNGILFRIAPDGGVTETLRGIGISNTLCWAPDGRTFYFADTLKNEIRAYAFDDRGRIGRDLAHFTGYERGAPDGSAIDAEGYLWNCRWGGGGIARIAPDGRLDAFVPIPTLNITTCVFGGPDLRTLFVTSARNDADPGDRLAGSLWAIDTVVPGLPENRVIVP